MDITIKQNIEIPTFPLPLYTGVEIAKATAKDGSKFSVFVGLDKKIVAELKTLSLDETDTDLQNNTSDRKRFGEGNYENWYKKNRTPFALIHEDTGALAALVWAGPDRVGEKTGNWHTFAWRSYPLFRGKGIMKNFTKFAMDTYVKNIPDIKMWITVKRENAGSIGLATFLGFQTSKEDSSDISLTMLR